MKIETDTIDKLYLELSQFTRATTRRELMYESVLKLIRDTTKDPKILDIVNEALHVGKKSSHETHT